MIFKCDTKKRIFWEKKSKNHSPGEKKLKNNFNSRLMVEKMCKKIHI